MKFAFASSLAALAAIAVAAPQYKIYDLGVAQAGDTNSQGFRISGNGIATGRSLASAGARAVRWTLGGTVGLPISHTPHRAYCVGNGVNDSGTVVGVGATTAFGSSRIPLMWNGTTVSTITLPSGQTLGDANDINNSGTVVGSVNSGSLQRAVYYSGGGSTVLSAATPEGWTWTTAFAVNNSGIAVGSGTTSASASVTMGLMVDTNNGTTTSVGALTGIGHNSAICFDVSDTGYVVGTSSLNSGANGRPFRWDIVNGMQEIPMPTGASTAIARGVNSAGWVVGIGSSAFALPFVYDGTATYRLGDLLLNGAGWDLLTNTSSSAMSISEQGWITGSGVRSGVVRAYVAIPAVTVSGTIDLLSHANDVGKTVAWEIVSGVTVLDSGTTTLGAGGAYSIPTIATGTAKLRVKARTWLAKVSADVDLASNVAGVDFALTNGDVNGENIVDIADYSYLATNFDLDSSSATWLVADGNGIRPVDSDLNGDGIVDIADYSILAASFDSVGE